MNLFPAQTIALHPHNCFNQAMSKPCDSPLVLLILLALVVQLLVTCVFGPPVTQNQIPWQRGCSGEFSPFPGMTFLVSLKIGCPSRILLHYFRAGARLPSARALCWLDGGIGWEPEMWSSSGLSVEWFPPWWGSWHQLAATSLCICAPRVSGSSEADGKREETGQPRCKRDGNDKRKILILTQS